MPFNLQFRCQSIVILANVLSYLASYSQAKKSLRKSLACQINRRNQNSQTFKDQSWIFFFTDFEGLENKWQITFHKLSKTFKDRMNPVVVLQGGPTVPCLVCSTYSLQGSRSSEGFCPRWQRRIFCCSFQSEWTPKNRNIYTSQSCETFQSVCPW